MVEHSPTPISRIGPAILAGLLLLFALACSFVTPTPSGTAGGQTGVMPAPETTPVPTQEPPPEVTPLPLDRNPGPACIGTFNFGMSCITETGWTLYNPDNSPLSSVFIKDIAVCPTGTLLILEPTGIHSFDGENWAAYDPDWGVSSPEAIACASEGQIWVAYFGGVAHFDGQEWIDYPSSDLAFDSATSDLLKDVAVSPTGEVWVSTARSVARFDGQGWEVFQEDLGFEGPQFFDKLAFDSLGRPWVSLSNGVAVYDDQEWHSYRSPESFTVNTMVFDHQDRLWIGTYSSGLAVFDGKNWKTYTMKTSELSNDKIQALAVDSRDRIWIGTEWGLEVLDGERWIRYQMHNSDLVDNNIWSLGVRGAGPAELPALQEKTPGTLTGRALLNGKPVADAPVLLCAQAPIFFSSQEGCSGHAVPIATRTDADGRFALTEIPTGRYVLLINSDTTGWTSVLDLFGRPQFIEIIPGTERNLGDLDLIAP